MRAYVAVAMTLIVVCLQPLSAQKPAPLPDPLLEVGEIVKLRTGGPDMTVAEIVGRNPEAKSSTVKCIWIDRELKLQTLVVSERLLLRSGPEDQLRPKPKE